MRSWHDSAAGRWHAVLHGHDREVQGSTWEEDDVSDIKPSQSCEDARRALYARLDTIERHQRTFDARLGFLEEMQGYTRLALELPTVEEIRASHAACNQGLHVPTPEDQRAVMPWPWSAEGPGVGKSDFLARMDASFDEARANLQEVVEGRDALRDMKLARLRDVQRELAMLIEQL